MGISNISSLPCVSCKFETSHSFPPPDHVLLLQVLLVSSKKDPCSWMVPGGGVEAGEETPMAAIREAWEEAGVQGHIKRYLGMFEVSVG